MTVLRILRNNILLNYCDYSTVLSSPRTAVIIATVCVEVAYTVESASLHSCNEAYNNYNNNFFTNYLISFQLQLTNMENNTKVSIANIDCNHVLIFVSRCYY